MFENLLHIYVKIVERIWMKLAISKIREYLDLANFIYTYSYATFNFEKKNYFYKTADNTEGRNSI